MEILGNFGFKPELFIAQIVNFLILAYVFKRFLYKPILKVLREREEKIKQSLEDAEKATEALARAEEERDEIIKKATKEAEKIINQTREGAEKIKEDILSDAKSESDRIIKETRAQAKLEMEKIEKLARSTSLAMSQKILEEVIQTLLSREEKEKVIKKGFEQIKKIS